MRQRAGILLSIVGIALLCTACGSLQGHNPSPSPTNVGPPVLNIFGPPGSKAAFEAIRLIYKSTDPPYDLRVYEGETIEPGVRGVVDGTFDLMLMMRAPASDEPLAFIPFVKSPVVLYVNPEAHIDNLSREQAAAVLAGEVTNWAELGGADLAIHVFVQEEDDSATLAVRETIMGDKTFTPGAEILVTERDILAVINGLPGAMGYLSWSGVKFNEFVTGMSYPNVVTLDGLSPEDDAYPMIAPIGTAFRPDHRDALQPLFEWGAALLSSGTVTPMLDQFGVKFAFAQARPAEREEASP